MTTLRQATKHLVSGLSFLLLTVGHVRAEEGGCIFTKELDNPVIAEEFRSLVENLSRPSSQTEEPPSGVFFENEQENRTVSFSRGIDIDLVSWSCLSCHNGGLAKVAATQVSSGPGSRARGLPTSHPIGMEYDRYRDTGGYRPRESMDSRMVFVAGKVGCITCHDPFNKEGQHLVMSNEWDRLCMSCHNK